MPNVFPIVFAVLLLMGISCSPRAEVSYIMLEEPPGSAPSAGEAADESSKAGESAPNSSDHETNKATPPQLVLPPDIDRESAWQISSGDSWTGSANSCGASAAEETAEQLVVFGRDVDRAGARLFSVSIDDGSDQGAPPITIPVGWNGRELDDWYGRQLAMQSRSRAKTPPPIEACQTELAVAFIANRSYWATFGGALAAAAGGAPGALSKVPDSAKEDHYRKFTLLEVRMLKRNLKPITNKHVLRYFYGDAAPKRVFFEDLATTRMQGRSLGCDIHHSLQKSI